MSRILIVEDEEKLARFLELELTHEGYETEKAGNGLDAVETVSASCRQADGGEPFDLVLLDVMLPGINGMEVLRRIRQLPLPPPVIMLTARDQVMDKVAGLDAGAVDYITKPFALEELLARIRVALKLHAVAEGAGARDATEMNERTAAADDADKSGGQGTGKTTGNGAKADADGIVTWGALTLDDRKHRVTYDDEIITLTNREFLMLKTLLENRDIVLSRDTLLSKVCGYDYVGETNVIDVYVRYLRSKIDERFGIKMIHTIRGVGYVVYSESAS